jgi:hypothetical protein
VEFSIKKLKRKRKPRPKVHSLGAFFEIGHLLVKGEFNIMDPLPVTDKVVVHGLPLDKFGNVVKDATGKPVALDAPETCVAANPLNLAVAAEADGTSFLLTPTGTIDPAESVTLSGLFKGKPITTGPVPVPIAAGEPVALGAVFDPPTPQ